DHVLVVLPGDERPSFWPTNGDSKSARSWRSVPPSHRPSVSPPTMTSVPFGVSAHRRRDEDEFPQMSRITWERCSTSAKSSCVQSMTWSRAGECMTKRGTGPLNRVAGILHQTEHLEEAVNLAFVIHELGRHT